MAHLLLPQVQILLPGREFYAKWRVSSQSNFFPNSHTRSAGLTSIQTVSDTLTTSSSTSSTESVSSTISESTSTSTSSSIESISTTSSSASTTSVTSTSTPNIPVSTAAPVVIETNSDGNIFTVTVQETGGPTPNVQALPEHNSTGFLQNKVASGLVFTIVAIIGLAFLATIVTFALRHSRKRKLHKEAINFDPPTEKGSMDKQRVSSDTYLVASLPHMPPSSTYNTRQYSYRLPPLPTFNNNQYPFNGMGIDNQRQQHYYGGAPVNNDAPYDGYTSALATTPALSYQPSAPGPIGIHSAESIQFQRGHTQGA